MAVVVVHYFLVKLSYLVLDLLLLMAFILLLERSVTDHTSKRFMVGNRFGTSAPALSRNLLQE
jgi:hypothetical protein